MAETRLFAGLPRVVFGCMLSVILLGASSGLAVTQETDVTKIDPNMAVSDVSVSGIAWHDPREKPFRLQGFKWIGQDRVYRRLPLTSDWTIPPKVDNLANQTSGGQIHFQTNSKKILLRVTLASGRPMYHMTQVAKVGFDCYIGPPGGQRFKGVTKFEFDAKTYTAQVAYNASGDLVPLVINFPLYNGVESVEIGLDERAQVAAPMPLDDTRPIVIYGTSITHGGCAARPGMSYPNILSRRLNQEVVNLGFSGSGKGEPEIAHLINEIPDKSLVILDFECNTHESLRELLAPFIEVLRNASGDVPILVISRIPLQRDHVEKTLLKRRALRDFQKSLVEKLRTEGASRIFFQDGETLLDPRWADEATVDGTHPTDLGFLMMAERLEPTIRWILAETEAGAR